MNTLRIMIATATVASVLAAPPGHAARTRTPGGSLGTTGNSPAAAYSVHVTQICAGALLFDSAHEMGTRSDALAIADDIRASTARRLDRVTALSVPAGLEHTTSRWVASQRQLAALYARTWVRIYDTIDATNTPTQQATLAERLDQLVHAPDALKLTARQLELELHVPDCTGGG
jgi:hypothetical protein